MLCRWISCVSSHVVKRWVKIYLLDLFFELTFFFTRKVIQCRCQLLLQCRLPVKKMAGNYNLVTNIVPCNVTAVGQGRMVKFLFVSLFCMLIYRNFIYMIVEWGWLRFLHRVTDVKNILRTYSLLRSGQAYPTSMLILYLSTSQKRIPLYSVAVLR